jgi:DNA (cytosine-5)-methyltransferase 1
MPYRLLNAAQFGVPQDRRRLILLGARRDTKIPEYPQPSCISLGRRSNGRELELGLGLSCGPNVWDAISDLPDIEDFEELASTDVLLKSLSGGSTYARTLRGELADPADYSYPRSYDPNRLTGCLRAQHTRQSRRRFATTTPGTTEPVSRFFRLAALGLCNTLRAGTATDRGAFTSPRPIHPCYDRCISVREAARLHSYPDWFRFHRTIWHGFRQIGNSVPPLLARAIGASVLRTSLGLKPHKPSGQMALGDDSLASLNMRQAAALFGIDDPPIAPRRRQLTRA